MSTTELQLPGVTPRDAAVIAAAESPRQPLVKIRPPGGWSPLALKELWQYRDLLAALAGRDIRIRYKQTSLGILWVVLQPVLPSVIFAFILGLANVPTGGQDLFLLIFTGSLGWQAFSSTLNKASDCVVGNSQLVSKVYFPRLILPLSTVLSTLIDFAFGLVLLLGILFWKGGHVGPSILMLPVALGLLILLAVGAGLFTSALMVTYRDFKHVVPLAVQMLMWAAPVNYSIQLLLDSKKLPEEVKTLYFLNPMVELIQVFRWSFLPNEAVHWGWFAYSAGMVVVIFLFGAFAFKRMERRFADVI